MRREFLRAVAGSVAAVPIAQGFAQTGTKPDVPPQSPAVPPAQPDGEARPTTAVEKPASFLKGLKMPEERRRGDMLYRRLGRTEEWVSAIGLGGHHIGRMQKDKDSIALMRAAIDAGITFMDNCWDYHDGKSERWMGEALKDGYRSKVFLMTKIDGRTRKAAAAQLDQSLKRLQVETIDLIQHHEILRMEDPDRIFGEDGAQAALEAARKAGKVRFVGFTGHKDPLVHLRMLEVARQHDFRFDTVQMPLNVLDANFRSFGQRVLPALVDANIAVLGMKSMGDGHVLKTGAVSPPECLRFAMSLPTATVITGIESPEILKQALDAARDFKPLSETEMAALLERTAPMAATGKFEPFKTTSAFDGTAKHPDWLGEPDQGPG